MPHQTTTTKNVDHEQKRLFIGGIPKEKGTRERLIRDLEKIGRVEYVPSCDRHGFAFIEMNSEADARYLVSNSKSVELCGAYPTIDYDVSMPDTRRIISIDETPNKEELCLNWQHRGQCLNGSECKYIHDTKSTFARVNCDDPPPKRHQNIDIIGRPVRRRTASDTSNHTQRRSSKSRDRHSYVTENKNQKSIFIGGIPKEDDIMIQLRRDLENIGEVERLAEGRCGGGFAFVTMKRAVDARYLVRRSKEIKLCGRYPTIDYNESEM